MSSAPELKPAIALRRISEPDWPATQTEEMRDDAYLLSLPLCRGRVRLVCDGGTVFDGDVQPGMLRILAPGERLRVERRSPAKAALLSVPGPLFRRIAADQGYRRASSALTDIEPVTRPSPHVERLAASLTGMTAIGATQTQLFLEGITLALLAVAFSPRQHGGAANGSRGLSEGDFARCVEFADAHLDAGLDVAGWAASLGLSPGEFVRRFQQTTRVAPYAWFLNWRVDRAKQLLADPAVPLAQIALAVGFSSQSHFTEAFRRRIGVSPGRWRNQRRGGIR